MHIQLCLWQIDTTCKVWVWPYLPLIWLFHRFEHSLFFLKLLFSIFWIQDTKALRMRLNKTPFKFKLFRYNGRKDNRRLGQYFDIDFLKFKMADVCWKNSAFFENAARHKKSILRQEKNLLALCQQSVSRRTPTLEKASGPAFFKLFFNLNSNCKYITF